MVKNVAQNIFFMNSGNGKITSELKDYILTHYMLVLRSRKGQNICTHLNQLHIHHYFLIKIGAYLKKYEILRSYKAKTIFQNLWRQTPFC